MTSTMIKPVACQNIWTKNNAFSQDTKKILTSPVIQLALLEPTTCMLKYLDRWQCLQLEVGHLSIVDKGVHQTKFHSAVTAR
jgi:hypothetical protein